MTEIKIDISDIAPELNTPAFVCDENTILENLGTLSRIRNQSDCKVLFPLKTFSIVDVLYLIASQVNGFSASSLFEAKLAREIIGAEKIVHITTPAFKPDEIEAIAELCDCLSFNSLSQFKRFYNRVGNQARCAIRINPQASFVEDNRYNPCRTHSKLGVPIEQFCEAGEYNSKFIERVDGILFHTNCESKNFSQLLETVKILDAKIPATLKQINWINLGGGYSFDRSTDWGPFLEAVALLKTKYSLEVFFEPGKGVVGEAGYIASSVVDIFDSGGKNIAVLDTSVNHMPEVFEYQIKPGIMQESAEGKYEYIVAGATCLAGDLFGEYRFVQPLKVGSKITFKTMGAYTMVKASMFNGINLPTIYTYTPDGKLELKKQFDYECFLSKCGGNKYVTL